MKARIKRKYLNHNVPCKFEHEDWEGDLEHLYSVTWCMKKDGVPCRLSKDKCKGYRPAWSLKYQKEREEDGVLW